MTAILLSIQSKTTFDGNAGTFLTTTKQLTNKGR